MTGPFDLTGRTALVTGSSRGIGTGLAAALARAGATVVLHGRDPSSVAAARDGLARSLAADGVHSEPATAVFDIRDAEATAAAVPDIEARVGTIDILVNNAGMQYRAPAEDFPLTAWRDVLDTNLTGPFVLAQQVARGMITRGRGKIVNICSVQNDRARGSTVAYAASKAALGSLGRAMCDAWAAHGIQVNGLAPGYIATDLNADLIGDAAAREWWLGRIPAGRFGTPEDLAGTLVWLASGASDYVNGQVIFVDGGMTAIV